MRKQGRAARVLAVCAMATLVGAVAVRSDDTSSVISAGKLAKHPGDYYGKTVTVKAEVEDLLGDNMFTLEEDALFAGPDVLVLVPKGLRTPVRHDEKVRVTGKVRRYVEAELKKDFDWFDRGKLVNVTHKVEWETRPVVVAETIETEDGHKIVGR
jgi:hypothetical protein